MPLTSSWKRIAVLLMTLTGPLGVRASVQSALSDPQTPETAEPAPASVGKAVDRAYLNQDIFLPKGQTIHNATCVFCSVQIEGNVTGRVLVLFGNLSATGRIERQVTVIGGNGVFDAQARVLGDTAVLFGNLVYETEDVLSGSAYVLGGHTSSFAVRQKLRHRLALSPTLLSTLVLLGFVLLLVAGISTRQRRLEH